MTSDSIDNCRCIEYGSIHRQMSIGGSRCARRRSLRPTTVDRRSAALRSWPPPLDAARPPSWPAASRALADPVRLRVLSILAAAPEGEVCVCDFVEPLGKSQPTVSHHLKILSEAGLVHGDRRGKWVWYSLNRDRLAELRAAIDS